MWEVMIRNYGMNFVKGRKEYPWPSWTEVTWKELNDVACVSGGIQTEMFLAHPLERQLSNQRTKPVGLSPSILFPTLLPVPG